MKIPNRILLGGLCLMLASTVTQADVLCVRKKTKANKKSGAVAFSSSFKTVATGSSCPKGFVALVDTQLFKGEKGDTGATGAQGLKGEKGDTGATGAQGLKGEKGDTGATGAQGPKGDDGSYPTELLSGSTIRGAIGGAGVVDLLQFVPISLPIAAPSAIQDEDMIIAVVPNLSDITGNCSGAGCLSAFESAKDASVCTGTFDNPTAPVGKLCVYVDVNYGAYDLEVQLMAKSTNPNGGSRFGGGLQWRTATGYVSKIKANWAYTAP